jgi:hypothetical protein
MEIWRVGGHGASRQCVSHSPAVCSPADGGALGGQSAIQDFLSQFLDNDPSLVTQPVYEPALLSHLHIQRTSSPEPLHAASMFPSHQFDPEPSISHADPGTADHSLFPQLSAVGPFNFRPHQVDSLFPEILQATYSTFVDPLAPELAEPRYQPPPGPPPQSYYPQPSGLGQVYAPASSGTSPLSPTGPSYLPMWISQPSVALSEQHQETANGSGLSMVYPNSENVVGRLSDDLFGTRAYWVVPQNRPIQAQAMLFREIQMHARCAGYPGPFIKQRIYVPHTSNDRLRYVTLAELEPPILFTCINPKEDGIHLVDALPSRATCLAAHDELVLINRGPSISLRLEV